MRVKPMWVRGRNGIGIHALAPIARGPTIRRYCLQGAPRSRRCRRHQTGFRYGVRRKECQGEGDGLQLFPRGPGRGSELRPIGVCRSCPFGTAFSIGLHGLSSPGLGLFLNLPSSLIVRRNRGRPVALKHQSDSNFSEPREILLTVQSDSRSVRAGAQVS
jgi:hypothetical protein